MKKSLRVILISVLAIGGLCIAGVAGMFFAKVCPPQGPWPLPPWCEGSTITIPSITELPPLGENLPSVGPSLTFNVTVPSNTPEQTIVSIGFYDENGQLYKFSKSQI